MTQSEVSAVTGEAATDAVTDVATESGNLSVLLQGGLTAAAKLEKARTELLDLTARNRLLNVPRSAKSLRTIDIVDEKSAEIFRLMVTENRPFTFLAGKAVAGAETTGDELAELAQPDDDSLNERGVLNRHADTRLQTRLTSKGLQKRLLDMYLDARTLEEEQGVNILFLALGTLKWLDPLNAKNVRYAPLVLLPVSLERGNAAEQFKLKWRQEDHSSNLSLEAFLERVHHLKMPAYEAGDDFDPGAYIDAVRQVVASKDGWEVLGDDIVLGFFSFSKFLMYRDLDPETWPMAGGLTAQPLIRGLLSDGFAAQAATIPEEAMLDDYIAPAELLHIVDCDSSQTLAVHDVRAGRNLVIQGPPGTGKSQTIANIIAAAVADGKTVLFVAEKMAALEVVKRRLDQAGVGDACLELHSNKANKKLLLDELRRTAELGAPKGQFASTLNQRLLETRNALNAHAMRLHQPHPAAGLTPYQVIGELCRLTREATTPAADHVRLVEPESWSPDQAAERVGVVRELAQRIVQIGAPASHPWHGVSLNVVLPSDVERLVLRIAALKERLGALEERRISLFLSLQAPPPATLDDFSAALDIAQRVAAAPDLPPPALAALEWDSRASDLSQLLAELFLLQELDAELAGRLHPAAFEQGDDGTWAVNAGVLHGKLSGLPGTADSALLDCAVQIDQLLPKLQAEVARLSRALGLDAPLVSYVDIAGAVVVAERVAQAPDVSAEVLAASVWDQGVEQAMELAQAVAALNALRGDLQDKVIDAAWDSDVSVARQVLAVHGDSILRFVSGEWRAANKLVKGILKNPGLALLAQLEMLDNLVHAQKLLAQVRAQDAFGQGAFGADWRGERSDAAPLLALAEWMRSLRGLGAQPRILASRAPNRGEVGQRAVLVQALLQQLRPLLEQLWLGANWRSGPLSEWLGVADAPLALISDQVARMAEAQALCLRVMTAPPPQMADKLALVQRMVLAQHTRSKILFAAPFASVALGPHWAGLETDWEFASEASGWISRNGSIRAMAASHQDRGEPLRLALEIEAEQAAFLRDMDVLYFDLCTNNEKLFGLPAIGDLPAAALIARFAAWMEHAEQLSTWVAYRERAAKARQLGIGEIVKLMESGQLAPDAALRNFHIAYFEAIYSDQVRLDAELGRFDGHLHQRLNGEFVELDKQRIAASSLEVVAAHHRRIPQGGGAVGPLGVLRGEMARRRGHMPIRQLMLKAAPAIQALKPVLMMSPLSVAQFLPAGQLGFDLLVMDEASQIQPVDALGAIARCRQVVVVGDERQLPPTKFFSKMTSAEPDEGDDDDAQVADIESILGLFSARGLPQRMLRWHYRSRHQSLIAVSNSQFYENKLFIVPSPYTQEAGMGLQFNHFPEGTFDSGNSGTNAVEAKAIAEAILRHARATPQHSLGVATFSVKQRAAIQDQLEIVRRTNPDIEAFFQQHPSEPFFIKNLENVQGDERDVIFISVGYARSPNAPLKMAFGPLSADGGERRLNVLISRAKRRCEVFASITDDDIDLERAKGRGVAAFKLFLRFARTGQLGLGPASSREFDSPFEVQVAEAVRACGYQVQPQVGIAGFFIDLGIADAERPGRYLLGIECDGPAYHGARSARDRDRLRQAVLEDHGWIIHRIWSLDWFKRPKNELQRLVNAIEAAKVELDARLERTARISLRAAPPVMAIERIEAVAITPGDACARVLYVEANPARPSSAWDLHEAPVSVLTELVKQIVSVEGPVHFDEVVVRLRGVWGLKRAGARIQTAVERAVDAAMRFEGVLMTERFLHLPDTRVAVRDRSAVLSDALRKPEMLPPQEIDAAILATVQENFGASTLEIAQSVSRLFGFKATSSQLRETVYARIDQLIRNDQLEQNGPIVALKLRAA